MKAMHWTLVILAFFVVSCKRAKVDLEYARLRNEATKIKHAVAEYEARNGTMTELSQLRYQLDLAGDKEIDERWKFFFGTEQLSESGEMKFAEVGIPARYEIVVARNEEGSLVVTVLETVPERH